MAEPLHFDVDSYIELSNRLVKLSEEGKGKLDILTLYLNDLIPTNWNAPAALEFKAKFDDWTKKEYRLYEDYRNIAERLFREINQWNEAASTFSS